MMRVSCGRISGVSGGIDECADEYDGDTCDVFDPWTSWLNELLCTPVLHRAKMSMLAKTVKATVHTATNMSRALNTREWHHRAALSLPINFVALRESVGRIIVDKKNVVEIKTSEYGIKAGQINEGNERATRERRRQRKGKKG